MDNIIVYVDDAAYGQRLLQPMLQDARSGTPTRWTVVGCPPRMTHRVSKWLARSTRDHWRAKWADKVFSQLVPLLAKNGDEVRTCMATSDLTSQTEFLIKQLGRARILDARRPKFGENLPAVTATQAPEQHGALGYFAAVAGAGLLVATD